MASHQVPLKEDDLALLSLIKEDNRLAFHQVYHKYWEDLYRYVLNILKDKWSTEDVLHEVFTKIWIERHSLEIKHLKAYLFVAVRNKALLKIRDAKYTSLDEHLIARLEIDAEVEDDEAYQALKSSIDEAVKKLPKRCEEIFYMNKFEHYSSAEIAAHFNISQRTVENQLSIALKHLRGELGVAVLFLLSGYFS